MSGLRKFIGRLWSVFGILFSFLLSVQTLLAGAADSLGARTARFALASFVPVAGGMIAEALSTLRGGMAYVRLIKAFSFTNQQLDGQGRVLLPVKLRQYILGDVKDVEISDDAFKPIEAIISSMTPAERANPALLNGSRKNRIAKGSGTSIVEVNRFLKQFEQTSKMMKKMQQMQGLRRR